MRETKTRCPAWIAVALVALGTKALAASAPYGGSPWPVPGTIEAEDYDTGGGLVISLLGHIPQKGEKAWTSGLEFEVTDADARRVKLVRARRVREDEEARE